jgi:hypothetical protein
LPHPEGSREAENVRARIASEFRALGDRVESRRDFVCGPNGACGDVVNLVVRRPGAARGQGRLRALININEPTRPIYNEYDGYWV